MKHVLNPSKNVILLEPSTFNKHRSIRHIPLGYAAALGTAIARELKVGYWTFWNYNMIGRPMMSEDPFDLGFCGAHESN
jgi:hypothetical protein